MLDQQCVYNDIPASRGELFEHMAPSSEMNCIVAVEGLMPGEKTSLLVDPSEGQLQQEFGGACKTPIPFHAIVRIDEADRDGNGRILQLAAAGK